ncbi:MAG: ribosome-associated translation inhibitor RaiA [Methylococcaceae bacterium]|nr:ribosome-associated translation inhibitor RaiA [Methylococcaceae bacterium]
MQLKITGHHIEVSEALRNYVNEKFQKLERHFEQVVDVHVILSVEKLVQKAEANVHVNGANLFAEQEDADLYAAIDGLIDKLDRQTIKHKEKLSEQHR